MSGQRRLTKSMQTPNQLHEDRIFVSDSLKDQIDLLERDNNKKLYLSLADKQFQVVSYKFKNKKTRVKLLISSMEDLMLVSNLKKHMVNFLHKEFIMKTIKAKVIQDKWKVTVECEDI